MDLYNESLDGLLDNTVRVDSELRDKENRPSLLAMMVYSYQVDKDLDEWMSEYAKNNHTYLRNQTKNFMHLRKDFERYCRQKEKSG